MKSLRFAIFGTLFLTFHVFSQIQIDTVYSKFVGPGIVHTKMVAPSIPWIINLVQIDLKNPYVKIKTVKALDKMTGLEWTTSMAARNSYEGHRVIAAFNGDGYSGGVPANIQLVDGEPIKGGTDNPTVGIDKYNNPQLGTVSFNGEVRTKTQVYHFYDINTSRGTDKLVLYNRFFGSSTQTNTYGAEALLTPISEWYANGIVKGTIDTLVDSVGNMPFSKNQFILSGHGSSRQFLLSNFKKGDTLNLFLGISPGLKHLKQIIGGFAIIVSGGKVVTTKVTAREPRTIAGFSSDSTKLFFATIDGRDVSSAGMTYLELGDFMLRIGMAFGINLDGGGSTTCVVRGEIKNRPSDGSERAVANSIIVVSSAPNGNLAGIVLNPPKTKVYVLDSLQFSVDGLDEYYNPFQLNPSQLQFYVDSKLGTISQNGVFKPSYKKDSGYVYVTYGALKDSAYIITRTVNRLTLLPKNIVVDTTRKAQFSISAFDQDDINRHYDGSRVIWNLTNPLIGSITISGQFKANIQGTTKIFANYDDVISDTSLVNVELGKGTSTVDSMELDLQWIPSKLYIDSLKIETALGVGSLGSASLKLDYVFTYQSSQIAYAYLDKTIPIFGVPDSILIDVRADSGKYRIYYIIEDDNKETYRLYSTAFADQMDVFKTIRASAVPSGTNFYFPITLKRIEIQFLGIGRVNGNKYRGSIYLDNLRVHYPTPITNATKQEQIPESFILYQNFPNPFNPKTVISYGLIANSFAQLRIFDILGREVTVLVNEEQSAGKHIVQWDAKKMASGIYFCRLQTKWGIQLIKLVLVK